MNPSASDIIMLVGCAVVIILIAAGLTTSIIITKKRLPCESLGGVYIEGYCLDIKIIPIKR